jgi:hypothetical protein
VEEVQGALHSKGLFKSSSDGIVRQGTITCSAQKKKSSKDYVRDRQKSLQHQIQKGKWAPSSILYGKGELFDKCDYFVF